MSLASSYVVGHEPSVARTGPAQFDQEAPPSPRARTWTRAQREIAAALVVVGQRLGMPLADGRVAVDMALADLSAQSGRSRNNGTLYAHARALRPAVICHRSGGLILDLRALRSISTGGHQVHHVDQGQPLATRQGHTGGQSYSGTPAQQQRLARRPPDVGSGLPNEQWPCARPAGAGEGCGCGPAAALATMDEPSPPPSHRVYQPPPLPVEVVQLQNSVLTAALSSDQLRPEDLTRILDLLDAQLGAMTGAALAHQALSAHQSATVCRQEARPTWQGLGSETAVDSTSDSVVAGPQPAQSRQLVPRPAPRTSSRPFPRLIAETAQTREGGRFFISKSPFSLTAQYQTPREDQTAREGDELREDQRRSVLPPSQEAVRSGPASLPPVLPIKEQVPIGAKGPEGVTGRARHAGKAEGAHLSSRQARRSMPVEGTDDRSGTRVPRTGADLQRLLGPVLVAARDKGLLGMTDQTSMIVALSPYDDAQVSHAVGTVAEMARRGMLRSPVGFLYKKAREQSPDFFPARQTLPRAVGQALAGPSGSSAPSAPEGGRLRQGPPGEVSPSEPHPSCFPWDEARAALDHGRKAGSKEESPCPSSTPRS